jgi:hypothetical protein
MGMLRQLEPDTRWLAYFAACYQGLSLSRRNPFS